MTSLNAVNTSILFQHVSKHMEMYLEILCTHAYEYQKHETTTE